MPFNVIDPVTLEISPADKTLELQASVAAVIKDGRLALVMNSELRDIPAWVEMDITTGSFKLVYQGGAYEILDVYMPPARVIELQDIKRTTLVSNHGGHKLMQSLKLITLRGEANIIK